MEELPEKSGAGKELAKKRKMSYNIVTTFAKQAFARKGIGHEMPYLRSNLPE